MNYNPHSPSLSQSSSIDLVSTFLSKVYGWMSLGLLITAATAFGLYQTPDLQIYLLRYPFLILVFFLLELGIVIYLSARIQSLSSSAALLAFLFYSLLNGITLSLIFLSYNIGDITGTFFITAGTFGIMSLYGYTTKRDLTSIGSLAFMALIGVILASLINFIFYSETLSWIITYAGVLIFVALTAYDTQRLKRIGSQATSENESFSRAAVMGALALYLDFINLFLFLLRIFGGGRD